MSDEFFDEMKEEMYSDNLPSNYIEPLDLEDICSYESYAHIYKNNGVTCTDGEKRYYIDSISYVDGEGFVFNLVETE